MENSHTVDCTAAAAYLHFSKGYLYRLVYLGKIPCYKPSGGKLFFKKDDLDAFMLRGRKGGGFLTGDKSCLYGRGN